MASSKLSADSSGSRRFAVSINLSDSASSSGTFGFFMRWFFRRRTASSSMSPLIRKSLAHHAREQALGPLVMVDAKRNAVVVPEIVLGKVAVQMVVTAVVEVLADALVLLGLIGQAGFAGDVGLQVGSMVETFRSSTTIVRAWPVVRSTSARTFCFT